MPKQTHGKYGENKSSPLFLRVTPTAKERLMEQAKSLNISTSELIERIVRGESLEAASLGESCRS